MFPYPSRRGSALAQTRFKRFDFVVLAGGIFLVILNVLLGHNNPQWHSVRNADFFDFLFKILQFKSGGYSTITQRTDRPWVL